MFNFMSLQKQNTVQQQTQGAPSAKSNLTGESKKQKSNLSSNLHAASIASPMSRKTKQIKKQQSQEQMNQSPWQNQQFRVFQKLIDSTDSQNNSMSAIQELAAKINSNKIDQDNQENIKTWFKSLSLDSRVNALTTTSPYLVEVLLNMQALIQKKGPIMFAKQATLQKKDSASKKNNDQHTGLDMYADLGAMGMNQHYTQGYSQSFLMGVNSLYQNQIAKFGQSYTPEIFYGSSLQEDTNEATVQQQFEQSFYCRVQHQNELKQIRDTQPKRHEALQLLQQNIRFADLYQYLDTITVTYELVENEELLFQALDEISGGMSLQNPCIFVYDESALMHQVEPPSWFKAQRFNCFEAWIASILEQNLWANFLYEEAKSCGQHTNLEYLFDANEMQEGLKSNQQLKLNLLSDVWLNTNQSKKTEVLKELEEENKMGNIPTRFFKIEHQNASPKVTSKELNQLSKQLVKRKKSSDGRDFILTLAHSTQARVESGKDFMYREFLKSIINLHQEQLIDELLSEPTQQSSPGKKKKKKTKKVEDNPLNQISNKKTKGTPDIQSIQLQKTNMSELSLQNSPLSEQQIEPITDDKISEKSETNHSDDSNNKKSKMEPSISEEEQKDVSIQIPDEQTKKPKNKKKKKKDNNGDGAQREGVEKVETTPIQQEQQLEEDYQETQPHPQSQSQVIESSSTALETSPQKKKKKNQDSFVAMTSSHKKNISMVNPELLHKFDDTHLEETSNQDSMKPRRRNRKKGKGGAVDHQQAMNQFIKNLNSKKDDGFGGKFTQKQSQTGKSSRIVSRKGSPATKHSSQIVDTSQKFIEKPAKQQSQIIFNETSTFQKKGSIASQPKKKKADEQLAVKKQNTVQTKVGPIYQEKSSNAANNNTTQVLAYEKAKTNKNKKDTASMSPLKIDRIQSELVNIQGLEIKSEPSTISAKEESKINASSPSFKPSLAAVLGQMEQPILEKAQQQQQQQQQHNQNSFGPIAQNLDQIKIFKPQFSSYSQISNDYGDEQQDPQDYYQYGYNKSSGVYDKQTRTFVPQYDQKEQIYSPMSDQPSKINIGDQIKNQQAGHVQYTTSTTTTTTAATGMVPIDQIGNLGLSQFSGQGIQDIIKNATKPPQVISFNSQTPNSSGSQGENDEQENQGRSGTNQTFFNNNQQHLGQNINFNNPINSSNNNSNFYPQINQLNSYNINQFGNLNIGQISNNMPVFQNIGNFQNFGNYSQSQGPQNLGQNNQFLNLLNQQYPQYFDYNLPQNIECRFYEKFDNDIYDEVNKIQQQLDVTREERNYVLNKLQAMCETVFKVEDDQSLSPQKLHSSQSSSAGSPQKQNLKPQIQQFGSLVTGLALESSDMDMAVTNLFLPDREKMIDCLDIFAQNLQKWEMIQDLNAISTASIPVIKATVDLNQLRDQEMKMEKKQPAESCSKDFGITQNDLSQEKPSEEQSRKKIPKNLAKLKIDITFDDNQNQDETSDFDYINEISSNNFGSPGHHVKQNSNFYGTNIIEQKTHLGLASSKLIKNYVENYKCLKEVSIILKQFLARMELNSPYRGGLSSYSTVLLLVAYMNKWNLKMSATLTPARLLMGFLDYYSYYFNVSLFGIDVSNGGSFYQLSSPESNFIILDPLNEQNNTTKSSYLTHDIIKSFRKAFNTLKNLLLQYQQTQNANITENLVDLILQRNQENSQDSQRSRNSSGDQSQGQQENESNNIGNGNNQNEPKQHIQIQIQQIQQIQILQQMQQ